MMEGALGGSATARRSERGGLRTIELQAAGFAPEPLEATGDDLRR